VSRADALAGVLREALAAEAPNVVEVAVADEEARPPIS
jgi:hypothetical protein